MKFITALKLLEDAVKENVLKEQDGSIAVYRKGTKTNQEGWYLTDKHRLAQELMNDENGQIALSSAIKNKRGL